MLRFWIRLSDIRTANYCDTWDCYLARAIKRRFPKAKVLVAPTWARIDDVTYNIPTRENLRLVYAKDSAKIGFHVRLKIA